MTAYPDTQLFVMPEERSRDIDSPLYLEVVAFLMRRNRERRDGAASATAH